MTPVYKVQKKAKLIYSRSRESGYSECGGSCLDRNKREFGGMLMILCVKIWELIDRCSQSVKTLWNYTLKVCVYFSMCIFYLLYQKVRLFLTKRKEQGPVGIRSPKAAVSQCTGESWSFRIREARLGITALLLILCFSTNYFTFLVLGFLP